MQDSRNQKENCRSISILPVIWNNFEKVNAENSTIKCSKVKKLLGVHIVYKPKSDSHVETICKKAHRKLSALSRITNYMTFPKKRILMNAVLKVQSNYYPIIWMFHSCCNKINEIMKLI